MSTTRVGRGRCPLLPLLIVGSAMGRIASGEQGDALDGKALKTSGIGADIKKREVRLDATVCLSRGSLEYLVCLPGTFEHETVLSAKGKLYLNGAEHWIRVQARHSRGPVKEYRMRALGGHAGGDDRLLNDLAKCVRGKGEPVAGAESGYRSILVADGAARSIRQGKVIDLTKDAQ